MFFVGWLGFKGIFWLLVGLLCPSTQSLLCRSDKQHQQASSPASRTPPSHAPALTLAEAAEADANMYGVGTFFALTILHTITPSDYHPPSHTTQHQHGRNLGREEQHCLPPSVMPLLRYRSHLGPSRVSTHTHTHTITTTSTHTSTPPRRRGPGNARRNTSRPALLLRPFGTASPSR